MLVHPWDAAVEEEWQDWLYDGRDFGQFIAPGRDRDLPVVVPTHFLYDGDTTIRLHLARPNPVWVAVGERPRALLTVIGDYVYIPAAWNAEDDGTPEEGVPTSYYGTVQLACDVRIIDDPAAKAEILNRQLVHFEPPESERLPVAADDRLLSGIRGLELTVTGVVAKFKVGGNRSPETRDRIADRLDRRRGPLDLSAREIMLRRGGSRPNTA
ncbi:MAG: FMN-binding negative transcriptional regulator [Streptosporangiaceae bacterium]